MKALLVWVACVVLVACGDHNNGQGDENKPILLTVYLGGMQSGKALEAQDGVVRAGGNVGLYSALMRVSSYSVTLADGTELSTGAASFDILDGTTVWEAHVASEPKSITLNFAAPAAQEGVLPGEDICVFLGGLIDGHPLEYRDTTAPGFTLAVPPGEPSGVVAVQFDVDRWFDNIDTSDLSGSDNSYRIDENDNPTFASQVETRIYTSARVCSACDENR
jgi:hypothetical protein